MGRIWKPQPADDVPDGVILFDGVCVLCSWWVHFIIERDTPEQFRFVPIQSAYGRGLAARWQIDPENPETNAAVIHGRAYFKSDAAIQALSGLPRWSWARVLAAAPRRLRDWLYDRVARNRYTLFGRTDTCLVPSPDLSGRFVFDVPVSDARATGPRSPFQRLLGAEFETLPQAVRRFHSLSRPLIGTGSSEVVTAPGILPWLISWVAGLPRAGKDVPVTVSFEPDGRGRERWRRRFARRRYSSVLSLGNGSAAGLIVERLEPFTLHFQLIPRPEGLAWSLVGWRFAGLKLPHWTVPKVVCHESGDGERFRFDIDAAFPWVGPVIRYRGWLTANQ